ncbi:NACHT domain-containing protein [Streptomyces sp. NPDC048277]|uniref:NACHT N-terminal Helical domain 1-containing protein n=1 Tax=Streptomyces sp. NPDC048277 TaxID=3155027 RepID=UPI0033EFA4B1
MQGLEVVLVRLASTVAQTVAKSLLTRAPGAGLVPDPVRPLPKPAGPDRLARVLGGRIAGAYAGLPEHERLAAVAAVQDTFAAAALDADRLFAADLDPRRLAGDLHRPVRDLAEPAQELYGELLGLCCEHLVEQLTTHPSFAARAAVEQTRRTGRLLREREAAESGDGLGSGNESSFEGRYTRFAATMHARLELFGVTLGGRRRAEWSLETAYLSLTVSGERRYEPQHEGMPEAPPTPVKVEQALATAGHRLLLRGPAGSGKSTLLQWLALNAARQSFGAELADWNRCVPFVLRLRSFRTPEGLPMPADFLTASGVPLQAPDSWVEGLLLSGRALVLVDGVDEVPARLRERTEHWLRSLVTAFPRARYVVTTRPSAVPEDWMAGQGFSAHTLLPMERDDIRTFVRHWHDAARLECGAEAAESEVLDRYEASLNEAVATRRDLGRLATNPLMCALLCALNRDRRMRLPRARKELYDAALDMLLVRRDTEREIASVEGVSLSRDEQTALLQRLAYWMIRNGQVEAARDEVVGMLEQWLAAMPQVREQGNAGQVFSHLLIRSGLLREPVPGYVDFVHRTFQDYLGAKAAVDARDFGVLVRNAHDDQWDDVVRMAVGHARVEERTRLLRQLLRRAEKVQKHRERLVLLAAASLEHAPELEPEVRREVEERTEGLLPPRSFEQAEALARAGELVLELLPGPDGLTKREATAVVRTAGSIAGDAAMEIIARFRQDERLPVRAELDSAWSSFDTIKYFEAILEGTVVAGQTLSFDTVEKLTLLPRFPQLAYVTLVGDHGLPPEVLTHTPLKLLKLTNNSTVSDLSPLQALPCLRTLTLDNCRSVTDLGTLSGLRITNLHVYRPAEQLSLAPLADLPELCHLTFDFAALETSLAELSFAPRLRGLGFFRQGCITALTGIEAMTSLEWLTVNEEQQWRDFLSAGVFSPLKTIQILDVPRIDLTELLCHQGLTRVFLGKVAQADRIASLTELPYLELVRFSRCGPIDLTPLAPLHHLKIELYSCDQVQGTELFPADRLLID